MKVLITPIAAVFFAGAVSAATDAEIYHGFAEGNNDLASDTVYDTQRSAVQPGIGGGTDSMRRSVATDHLIYRGFEVGNNDLYSGHSASHSMAVMPGIGSPRHSSDAGFSFDDIYHGFEKGNPDL